ncbi:aldose epimerase family protein [Microbulbifer thermotolerans]|uniref:Galactose mutarotase n=1 Tax=Microbulbifer thermotolerans TaxID=252514 RepID=A0A143HN09_MICTH|nr:hypothetical protein [Microbulbifer thermotolerans]AMX02901.1 hypothetical protein A3224_10225 [Microbulbifer thermotolerans]MCX2835790.1 hypothetical protein [Microbulbifer thermotolerans]
MATPDTATITPCHIRGLSAYKMQNRSLSLIVVPQLGGKIVSLCSGVEKQTEWLWHNGRISYKEAAIQHSYTEQHDTGGIDECFPSVDACTLPSHAGPLAGLHLPDHGELYGRPWRETSVGVDSNGAAFITLKQSCSTLPCEFQRTLKLSPAQSTVSLEYQLNNPGDLPFPFSWCLHPALQLRPGMRLILPKHHRLHCSFATPNAPVTTDEVVTWPKTANAYDLSLIPDPEAEKPFAAKLLSATDLSDCGNGGALMMAGLHNPYTNEQLLFELPITQIPHIALWLNYRSWAGDGGRPHFNLVLEPAIGNADSLKTLIERGTAPTVPPQSSRSWSFQIHIKKTQNTSAQ